MSDSPIDTPAAKQPARIAMFNYIHLVIFFLFWFPLNPIVLNLYRVLAFDGLGPLRAIADFRQFPGLISASILGPYTAAVEGRNRDFCLDAASRFLPFCLGAVCFGALIQFAWRPDSRLGKGIRYSIWAVGWFVWFAGAFASILINSG